MWNFSYRNLTFIRMQRISSRAEQFSDGSTIEPAFGKTILLIVDDNVEMVTYLVEAFSKEYCCLYALNGKDG